jgi:hypothetical protein
MSTIAFEDKKNGSNVLLTLLDATLATAHSDPPSNRVHSIRHDLLLHLFS